MSVYSVFYPNSFSEYDMKEFMRNPLWDMALGAHFNLDGKLFIAQTMPDRVTMSDRYGFPVLQIMHRHGHYRFTVLNDPKFFYMSNATVLADSSNKRYLLARLADKKSGVRKKTMRESIMNVIRNIEERAGYADILKPMFNRYTIKLHPTLSSSDYEIDLKAQEWALLLAYGHKTLVEVPSDVRPILDLAVTRHREKHTRYDAFVAEATDFFSRDKWVATYIAGYGYICAKIDCRELVSFCKTRAKTSFVDLQPDKIKFVAQSCHYANSADMPDPVRRELFAALSMAKTNLPEGMIKSYVDPDKLMPDSGNEQFVLQDRVGAMMYKEGSTTWVMVEA